MCRIKDYIGHIVKVYHGDSEVYFGVVGKKSIIYENGHWDNFPEDFPIQYLGIKIELYGEDASCFKHITTNHIKPIKTFTIDLEHDTVGGERFYLREIAEEPKYFVSHIPKYEEVFELQLAMNSFTGEKFKLYRKIKQKCGYIATFVAKKEGDQIFYAVARCHPKDQYSKKKGREVAIANGFMDFINFRRMFQDTNLNEACSKFIEKAEKFYMNNGG